MILNRKLRHSKILQSEAKADSRILQMEAMAEFNSHNIKECTWTLITRISEKLPRFQHSRCTRLNNSSPTSHLNRTINLNRITMSEIHTITLLIRIRCKENRRWQNQTSYHLNTQHLNEFFCTFVFSWLKY